MQLNCIKFVTMGIVRKTKAVNTVLNIFEHNNEAKSVVNLIELVKGEMNKTTVYRILDRLEQDGTIHCFNGKDGLKWYAKCRGCSSTTHHDVHPHFQCLECGKVDCLKTNFIIPEIANRKVEVSQVLLQGKCEECYSIVS